MAAMTLGSSSRTNSSLISCSARSAPCSLTKGSACGDILPIRDAGEVQLLGKHEEPRQESGLATGGFAAENAYPARGREEESGHQSQQCRFTGPVEPDQAVDAARVQAEVHVPEERFAAVSESESFQFHHRADLLITVLVNYYSKSIAVNPGGDVATFGARTPRGSDGVPFAVTPAGTSSMRIRTAARRFEHVSMTPERGPGGNCV